MALTLEHLCFSYSGAGAADISTNVSRGVATGDSGSAVTGASKAVSTDAPRSIPAAAILQDITATFKRGTITAVTGPNGCGKTTLAKLMTGMLRPSAGRIFLDGDEIASMTLTQIGRRVGLVMQNPERQMFCTSIRAEVEFGLRNFGFSEAQIEERRKRYLEIFGLAHCEERFPFELSGGEKQRVMLAAVLATGPSYLVLDEPTSALDRGRRRVLGELLLALRAEEGVGIVLISHDEDFLQRYVDERIEMGEL